ncbi:MAG TPA: DUF6603 domain-containing protein [Candidatus Limnocylindrales bacterium]|nr:DUF6603 domain-containing protein [Candidatus Limnocylindrales bacterium]
MPSTLDRLAYEAGQLLKVLGTLASADGGPVATLNALGWEAPPGSQDLGLGAIDISALVSKLEALDQSLAAGAGDDVLAAEFAEVLFELQQAIVHIRATIAGLSITGDYLDKTQIKSEILGRFSSALIASRIGAISPLAYALLQFFGVITLHHFDADPSIYQVEHIRVNFDWGALTKLVTDPLGLLESRYGWGTAAFDADGFIVNLNAIVEVLGQPTRVRKLPRRVEEQLTGSPAPAADTNPLTQVIGTFVGGMGPGTVEAGISMFPLRATTPNGSDGGIAVAPFVYGSAEVSFPLSENLTLGFDSTVALDSGIALQFRPGHDMSIKAGLLTDSVEDHVTGGVMVSLAWAQADGSKINIVSLPGGGVVEVGSVQFGAGVEVLAGSLAPSFSLKLTGGHATLRRDGADSFVSSVVPSGGVDATFDAGLRWSATQGFSFEGSGSIAIDLPLNATIGPLQIVSLHFELLPDSDGLGIEASVTCGLTIGPVAVVLQRFGGVIGLAAHDGNLGPIDASFHFKPPSGAGLSIDAAGVTGGGFLSHDDTKQEYAGMVQLQFAELALQGFGLITTQVAGGSGYSLLALIDATFPPVQLGWGFTLNGVGGMMAVHRTASADALHAALKANTLSQVLFPKTAVTNAPLVLAQLDALFPTAPGRFLFSPMALIGWGTPTLLTAAIAVIVELPEPIRIVLIARVSVRAPSDAAAVVRLNMDALGILDFAKGEASLDATLYDSHILNFTLSGDMALRASWSTNREFLLAVGGFHPQFTPPAGFPSLKRITLDMPSGPISKLTLAAYFAITSNTVQLGATIDAFIGVSDFGLKGHLGFNALLQFDPFHFETDISATVALMAGSDELMSVDLSGTLSGPNPWSIAGSFKISLLFFDVHLSFSHTWGATLAEGAGVAAVDVLQLLNAAFADARNWHAPLPVGVPALVSTRDSGGGMKAHPLAVLEVHQTVAPLDLTIARYGTAALAGANRFTITGFTVGSSTTGKQDVQEDFAPAQYFDLSDDEKLARPSFEPHNAGARMSAGAVRASGFLPKPVSYKTLYVDKTGEIRKDTPPRHGPIWDLPAVLATGAGGRGVMRATGDERYRAPGKPLKVVAQQFVVIDARTMAVAAMSPLAGATYSLASAALKAAGAAAQQQFRIVATHEVQE